MINSLIALTMRSRALRIVLNAVRFREGANWLLRRRPLLRQAPGSALVYRIAGIDSLVVAREVFAEGEYAVLDDFPGIHSFVDLGCNAGYFTVFLAAHARDPEIRGLAIDAHPAMVESTRWHAERNGLRNVQTAWGLVGSKSEGERGRFFVNVDSPGSSQFDRAPEGNVTKNPWKAIEAPVLSLREEWTRRFGDLPCDVLKVDIEGSEDLFLHQEAGFLARAGLLLIEMHKWIVDVPALEAFLAAQGFAAHRVLRSDDIVHVAVYVNRAGRFAGSLASAGSGAAGSAA